MPKRAKRAWLPNKPKTKGQRQQRSERTKPSSCGVYCCHTPSKIVKRRRRKHVRLQCGLTKGLA